MRITALSRGRTPAFLATALVAMGLLASSLVVTPSAAYASAPTCRGIECEGKDPAQTNCVDDAITIQSTNARVGPGKGNRGHLEMRYSKKCHSNWVRYTGWRGPQWFINKWLDGSDVWAAPYIWREGVDGTLQGLADHSSIVVVGSPTFWTKMVTADGATCSSVELTDTVPAETGHYSEQYPLGTYNAPCIG